MQVNQTFVDRAELLVPTLYETIVRPVSEIEVVAEEEAFQGWATHALHDAGECQRLSYGKNDSFILDFGDHYVGYLVLSVKPMGSLPDAPLSLKLIFGEMPCEVAESFESYQGEMSKSWLQEETIYVDVLPAVIRPSRRYAFRYVKVIVLDTSPKYNVQFTDIRCIAVTSADVTLVEPLPASTPADLVEMDRIGRRTLQNCMQTVFEDGPKRDRRLWIGDLRLQALANYETFGNRDLVKRCLYLFGGMTLADGAVGACVYERPHPQVDDVRLYDYSLFFVATLHDYYYATKDRDTLTDLWPVAWEQIGIAVRRLDDRGIVQDDSSWWCSIDWHTELNKQASAQAILIYCLRRGLALSYEQNEPERARWLEEQIAVVSEAAMKHLWDGNHGFFISGPQAQVSWASQIFMVLAEVLDAERQGELMDRLFVQDPDIRPVTPYLYHHLIEALLLCGRKDKALEEMRAYWGAMAASGADTFWELYDRSDSKRSPYGSHLINSYCHAWSCTPAYFIRKYFTRDRGE